MLGVVRVRCDRVSGAASYLFAYTTQRDAPAGSGKLIVTTKASAVIADTAPGTRVYVRVAVVRAKSGQGTWSEPVETLVR